MNSYDVVIIGTGLAGLTAGVKLAREGKKVAMVEQHFIPGGCATTFKRKGYTVEVGLHELDGLYEGDNKVKIFNEFEVFDHVKFLKAPEFYRFKKGDLDFVVPDDADEAIAQLIEKFPSEEKAIRKFFDIVIGIRKELSKVPQVTISALLKLPFIAWKFPKLFKYHSYSVGDLLHTLTDNDDLKLLLTANVGYYHDDPQTLSLLYFSAGNGSYYLGGGHYIQGGSQQLSNYLAGEIKKRGGEIFFRTMVTEVTEAKGRVTGIKAVNTKTNEELILSAPIVIANNAIPNLSQLLQKGSALKLLQQSRRYETACSITTLYIGFSKPPREFGCENYSTFIAPSNVNKLSEVRVSQHSPYTERGFVFVDYDQVDSKLAPEGKALGVVCLVDYIEAWEDLTPEEYKKKKQDVTDIIIKRLEEEYPGISEAIEYSEIGTPKTIKRYTLNPKGSPYGYAQLPHQAIAKRLMQKGVVRGLYYASAWTLPGGGFTGAIMSGYNCGRQILYAERFYMKWLQDFIGLFKK